MVSGEATGAPAALPPRVSAGLQPGSHPDAPGHRRTADGNRPYGENVIVLRLILLRLILLRLIVLRRGVATAIATVIAVALVAGCGSVTAPELSALPAPASGAPSTTPDPSALAAAPTAAHPAPLPAPQPDAPDAGTPVTLPWPPGDPATLQSAVDAGSQPWLLDATEVAISYAAAVNGWTDADATRADGITVLVRNRQGETLRVTVAQPGRTGPGGIWRVTAIRT